MNDGRRSLRWLSPGNEFLSKEGNGVRGVLGVEMYRPLHFGQRTWSSVEDADTGVTP